MRLTKVQLLKLQTWVKDNKNLLERKTYSEILDRAVEYLDCFISEKNLKGALSKEGVFYKEDSEELEEVETSEFGEELISLADQSKFSTILRVADSKPWKTLMIRQSQYLGEYLDLSYSAYCKILKVATTLQNAGILNDEYSDYYSRIFPHIHLFESSDLSQATKSLLLELTGKYAGKTLNLEIQKVLKKLESPVESPEVENPQVVVETPLQNVQSNGRSDESIKIWNQLNILMERTSKQDRRIRDLEKINKELKDMFQHFLEDTERYLSQSKNAR
jgi:hypothetical protein